MAPNIHRLLRAGLLIVVFVILLATAYLAGVGNMQTLREDAFTAGYEEALADYGIARVAEEEGEDAGAQTRIIMGTITDVTPGGLMVLEDADPGSAEEPETYAVVLAEGATIIGLTPKDPAALEAELAAYNRRVRSNPKSTEAPPAPDTEAALTLADLRVGDRITTQTFSDEEADPVVAERITRTATAPPPPPEAATTTP